MKAMSNKARNLQDEDSTTYQAPIISLIFFGEEIQKREGFPM